MTTEPIDPYATLGLPRDATTAEISDAALQHVLTAYTVLRDRARRFDPAQQTNPRTSPARTPAPRIHLSRKHPFDDSPLRAGPVHWTP